MTSCPPTQLPRSPRFRSAVEVAVELAHLVLVVHRDQLGPRVTQALPDLRGMLVSVVPQDLQVPRALRDPLVVALEAHPFPDPRAIRDPLDPQALPDPRVIRGFKALLDLPVLQESVDQLDRMLLLLS